MPEVKLLVKFVFSQVVNHTDKREDHNLGEIMFMRSIDQSAEIGVNQRTIFDWKDKEPGEIFKEKAVLYCKILD